MSYRLGLIFLSRDSHAVFYMAKVGPWVILSNVLSISKYCWGPYDLRPEGHLVISSTY
jgi:hypothetical protein